MIEKEKTDISEERFHSTDEGDRKIASERIKEDPKMVARKKENRIAVTVKEFQILQAKMPRKDETTEQQDGPREQDESDRRSGEEDGAENASSV